MTQAITNNYKKALLDMFGTDKALYEKAIILINDLEDFREFVNNHMGKPCSKLMAIASFRKWKLNQRKFTFFEFVEFYQKDAKKALENLALLPIDYEQVSFIDTLLDKGSLTLEDVYNLHQEEPDKPIIRLVLARSKGES